MVSIAVCLKQIANAKNFYDLICAQPFTSRITGDRTIGFVKFWGIFKVKFSSENGNIKRETCLRGELEGKTIASKKVFEVSGTRQL